jgi:D-alanine-D-alanine ligase
MGRSKSETSVDLTNGAIQTLDITVLMGGPSAEREVSLQSGRAVAEALESLGHRVYRADVSPEDLGALDRECDVVFIALHGTFGEDGTLQAELERRGRRYVGSGPEGSALAMDKVRSKRRFVELGVPTPPYRVAAADNVEQVAADFAVPAVVKPVAEGSSVDVVITRNRPALQRALASAIGKYGRAMVEAFIRGPELTVGILGDVALPVCEIRPKREFYDYAAKYEDDATQYLFDPDLPAELLAEVQRLSLRVHQGLGCRHLSRVDWILDAAANRPYCLEVNTIPGFTSHSLVPKAAARMGLSFARLCQRIVELALQ